MNYIQAKKALKNSEQYKDYQMSQKAFEKYFDHKIAKEDERRHIKWCIRDGLTLNRNRSQGALSADWIGDKDGQHVIFPTGNRRFFDREIGSLLDGRAISSLLIEKELAGLDGAYAAKEEIGKQDFSGVHLIDGKIVVLDKKGKKPNASKERLVKEHNLKIGDSIIEHELAHRRMLIDAGFDIVADSHLLHDGIGNTQLYKAIVEAYAIASTAITHPTETALQMLDLLSEGKKTLGEHGVATAVLLEYLGAGTFVDDFVGRVRFDPDILYDYALALGDFLANSAERLRQVVYSYAFLPFAGAIDWVGKLQEWNDFIGMAHYANFTEHRVNREMYSKIKDYDVCKELAPRVINEVAIMIQRAQWLSEFIVDVFGMRPKE